MKIYKYLFFLILLGGCGNLSMLVKELPEPIPPNSLNVIINTEKIKNKCFLAHNNKGSSQPVCFTNNSTGDLMVFRRLNRLAESIKPFMDANKIDGNVLFADKDGTLPNFEGSNNPYILLVELNNVTVFSPKAMSGSAAFKLIHTPTKTIIWRRIQSLDISGNTLENIAASLSDDPGKNKDTILKKEYCSALRGIFYALTAGDMMKFNQKYLGRCPGDLPKQHQQL